MCRPGSSDLTRARRNLERWATALVALLAAAAVNGTGTPAWAQETCRAEVDGRDVAEASRPQDAFDIDADSSITIAAVAPDDADDVRVVVDLPIAGWTVVEEPIGPGDTYVDTIDVAEFSRYGVLGLHRIDIEAGSCRATAWVRITGRSPFTTPLGIGGAGLAGVGVFLLVTAMARARAGSASTVRGFVGGALCGAGTLVLAQQFGWVAATDKVVASWVGVPGAGGALLTRVARLGSGRPTTTSAAPPEPAPPASPAPPPPVAAAPPPVAAPPPPVATPPPPVATPPPPASPAPSPVAAAPPPVAAAPPPVAAAPPPVGAEVGSEMGADVVPISDDNEDPPREAHPRIEAPDPVVAGVTFDLVVGLSPTPVSGTLGGPVVRPPTSVGPYALAVHVVADGFVLADPTGGGWRRELPVTAAAPYPETTFRLAALPHDKDFAASAIQVLFSVDGQTVGTAFRPIGIVSRPELLDETVPLQPGPTTVMAIASHPDPADLTVRILRPASRSDGRLLWTFESPHGVDLPDEAVTTDIGSTPDEFTRRSIVLVAQHRNRATLVPYLSGLADEIAAQMPTAFFDLLRAVAAKLPGRPPRVLLLSAEPYIWWELAAVDPPLDPAAPSHLGAQADVGRWVLADPGPPLPPPVDIDAATVAVVFGTYPAAEWQLVEAEAEAKAIVATWQAASVNAAAQAVVDCLGGMPEAGVLHFALHGSYAPAGVLEGLILVDGDLLDPTVVQGCELPVPAFVFLNACQVGNGNVVLGDYAGLAEAFLGAGAAAVVAPLWSIDDAAAHQLALRFYKRVLDDGASPAGVLRDERCTYAAPGGDGAATRLAYQFFGHPALTLSRRR